MNSCWWDLLQVLMLSGFLVLLWCLAFVKALCLKVLYKSIKSKFVVYV